MKKILLIFLLLYTVLFFSNSVIAQQLECDECGYCIGREAPGSWESCRACIYEGSNEDPASNETLRVTKTPGRYYTQLGCLNTEAESFTDPTAQGGLLNFLLSRLLFPIVGTLSFISLIYGAFLLMTAQGSSEQVGRGKSYIVGAIVGLIFTLSAVLIINIIAGDILRIPGFSNGSVVKMYAGGQPSELGFGEDAVLIHPIVEVTFGSEVVGRTTIISAPVINQSPIYKEFNIVTSRKLREGETVTIRFINDHAPKCCGREGGPQDNGNGDRNFYLKTAEIDTIPCKSFTYKEQNILSGFTVYANQSFPITCNFN